MPRTTVAVLAVAGLISLAIALRALLAPQALATGLGLGILDLSGMNEVRAQYGGFYLTVAITCLLGAFGFMSRPAALVVLATTFGGILLGRVISAVIDGGIGNYSQIIQTLYLVDLVGFLAAVTMLKFGTETRV
jgi:hypothetical protein